MFKKSDGSYRFKWSDLGDLNLGRPCLGELTSVAAYRLMQYTLREVLTSTFSAEQADQILRQAGKLAGREFCCNVLDRSRPFAEFIAQLQVQLRELRVGILRIEKSNLENLDIVLTVEEDLDCSGLPASGETICDYDEGFIAGILEAYTGTAVVVREVDCWASGERVCRFRAESEQGSGRAGVDDIPRVAAEDQQS